MTIPVANVSLANTFGHWVTRTNELAYAMTFNVVTVGGNAAIGNAQVIGSFTANTIRADVLTSAAGANLTVDATTLIIANTSSLQTVGSLNINGNFTVNSVSTMRINGANATHRVLASIDANTGQLGYIQVDFPLDQLTDVDTSNVGIKDNETILKFNANTGMWQANTLSLINATRINTLNVGTITSVLTVSANANIGNNTLVVNRVSQRVGINTNAPNATLTVNGAINATGDISGFQTSDEKFKDDVRALDSKEALGSIVSLRPVKFEWNQEAIKASAFANQDNYGQDVGLIAQEVRRIFPDAVIERPDGTLAVNYSKLITYLIAAVQELNKKVD